MADAVGEPAPAAVDLSSREGRSQVDPRLTRALSLLVTDARLLAAESDARYRLMVEGSQEVFFYIHDVQHRIEYLSPSVHDVLGYPPEHYVGGPYEVMMTGDPSDLLVNRFTDDALKRGGGRSTYPMLAHHRDGHVVILELVESPIVRDGVVVGMHGFARDITERRRLEERVRQSQKLEAVGRLAGGIAHDFNNILTVIVAYSDALRASLDQGDARRADVDEICKAADCAATLTRQLLDFSRQQPTQRLVLDLNQVVFDMETMLRRLLGSDIHVAIVLAPDLGRVRADAGQVAQILMNLAVNARDAMPGGGTLTIETKNAPLVREASAGLDGSEAGPQVLLTVRDSGIGMEPGTMSRMFEPFFTTKPVGHGTGLGLATVYGIVQQSGGVVDVSSAPGAGTTFCIALPRVAEPETAE